MRCDPSRKTIGSALVVKAKVGVTFVSSKEMKDKMAKDASNPTLATQPQVEHGTCPLTPIQRFLAIKPDPEALRLASAHAMLRAFKLYNEVIGRKGNYAKEAETFFHEGEACTGGSSQQASSLRGENPAPLKIGTDCSGI